MMLSPVLLIALPLLLAFIATIFKSQQRNLIILGLGINVVLLLILEKGRVLISGFMPPYGISLNFDGYAWIGLILIQAIMLITIWMNLKACDKYGTLLLVLVSGLNGMLLTNDLFNLFVMIEIVSISAFILSGLTDKHVQAFHYLILGSVGGLFFLMGTVIIYVFTGTFELDGISSVMSLYPSFVTFIPGLFIIVGLAVEMKLIPVGSWARDVYSSSNELTGPLFSAVIAPTFAFVFGRLMNRVVILDQNIGMVLLIMGTLTLVLGELSAYKQKDIKRTLAFSSIAQSGLVTLFLTLGFLYPAILLIINNAISKFILFSVATGIEKGYSGSDEKALKGVFYHHKLLGVMFTVASLSLIGMPLFFGFFAKLNAVLSILDLGLIWLPISVLAMAVVEGAYMMKWLLRMWSPSEEGHYAEASLAPAKSSVYNRGQMSIIIAVTLLFVLMGLLPNYTGPKIAKVMQISTDYQTQGVQSPLVAEGGRP